MDEKSQETAAPAAFVHLARGPFGGPRTLDGAPVEAISAFLVPGTMHDGTDGELYDLRNDPLQHVNLWHSAAHRAMRDDLLDDMWRNLPAATEPRRTCDAPV